MTKRQQKLTSSVGVVSASRWRGRWLVVRVRLHKNNLGRIKNNWQEGRVFSVLIWWPRDSEMGKSLWQSPRCTSFNKMALHRMGGKGYGGQRAAMAAVRFTLEEERDSRADKALWSHPNTAICHAWPQAEPNILKTWSQVDRCNKWMNKWMNK